MISFFFFLFFFSFFFWKELGLALFKGLALRNVKSGHFKLYDHFTPSSPSPSLSQKEEKGIERFLFGTGPERTNL